MTTKYSHIPVLLNEVVEALKIPDGKKYIDCTFGGGGYSRAIAEKGGIVLGVDVDQDAVDNFSETKGITLVQGNFENLQKIAEDNGFFPCDGIVFDLGVSSYQIDTADRGFSFLKPGKIDMRMDKNLSDTAGELLDLLDEKAMAELFLKFSDEMHSWKIARGLIDERERLGQKTDNSAHPIVYWQNKLTIDLANTIAQLVGGRKERIHPATRVFQALRMAVNDELGSLSRGIEGAFETLNIGGRIVVVSFHSIEDRVIKSFIEDIGDRQIGKMIGDIILPSADEIRRNPRCRSARLRVIEKTRK